MSTACGVCGRPQGVEGVRPMWTHVDRGEGVKNLIFFYGRHKWMALYALRFPPFLLNSPSLFYKFPYFQMVLCSYTKLSFTYQNVIFPSPYIDKIICFPFK